MKTAGECIFTCKRTRYAQKTVCDSYFFTGAPHCVQRRKLLQIWPRNYTDITLIVSSHNKITLIGNLVPVLDLAQFLVAVDQKYCLLKTAVHTSLLNPAFLPQSPPLMIILRFGQKSIGEVWRQNRNVWANWPLWLPAILGLGSHFHRWSASVRCSRDQTQVRLARTAFQTADQESWETSQNE